MFIALITSFFASSREERHMNDYMPLLELAKYAGASSIDISRLWRSEPITLIPMTFICTPFI
jgi:hypothetical protein